MPRHHPGDPPAAEPGRTGRRLAAAVCPGVPGPSAPGGGAPGRGGATQETVRPIAGTGLLDGPPFASASASASAERQDRGPDQPEVRGPRIRWRTGRRAAAVLCLLATVFLGWFWLQAVDATTEVSPLSSTTPTPASGRQDPDAEAGPSTGASTAPDASPGDSDSGGGGDGGGEGGSDNDSDAGGSGNSGADTRESIIVHVAGAVVRAGIVELPRGSRLHEAIAAAGGGAPGADPNQLNLAAVLEDGQKVLVPREGETVAAAPSPTSDAGARGTPDSAGGSVAAGEKINLNTASAEELATLPRVGPVLAQRIVDWRKQHGDFQRVEELDAVDGFGPKLLEGLLPLVRV